MTDHYAEVARIRAFFERHPELAGHVRNLTLRTVPRFPRYDWLIPPTSGYHDPSLLLCLLRLFPRLRHVSLQDIFVTPAVSLATQSPTPLPALQSLQITSKQEEIPPSDITLLLNLFTEVDTLDIAVTCYFDWRRQRAHCPPTDHLAVRSLSTRKSTDGSTLAHLAQSPSARTLHTISLGSMEAHPIPGVQELLLATRANLECLQVSFRAFWDDSGVDIPPAMSLACCTALRRLELAVRRTILDWQRAWCILATLSADTCRALEDVTIEVRTPGFDPRVYPEDLWRAADPAVLRATYETLVLLSRTGRFRRLAIRETSATHPPRCDNDVFPGVLQRYIR